VIVIVGREADNVVRSLAERWRPHAAVLSPRDLSRRGWRYSPAAPLEGQAVVSGDMVPAREIEALVTLLDHVEWHDLQHVVAADRPYVACEMRAFLLAWLQTLPCTMLNRPTATSLIGCGWRPERWGLAAAALGIPTAPTSAWHTPERDSDDTFGVTYVGGEVFDSQSSRVTAWVRRLASVAQTGTLAARFCDGVRPLLRSVTIVPDLGRPDVADAALRWLRAQTS
jgi:hypothetical protein